MERLHLPDNIKVHFAGCENFSDAKILDEMGGNYCLFSALPFVLKKVEKDISETKIPTFLSDNMKHVIQDSGLYSMLFGKLKGEITKKFVFNWYDAYVGWTIDHGRDITCVELDAQSIIGVDETWSLRKKIKEDLPNNRIINVFHLQDGQYGLDRLIDYSDYLAIGMVELRKFGKQDYAYPLVQYIKKRKPSIDIHLLGFTDFAHIRKYRYCTSCDSITWLSPRRFGELENERVANFDTRKVQEMVGVDRWFKCKGDRAEEVTNTMCVSVERWKHKCTRMLGNQDVKWIYND